MTTKIPVELSSTPGIVDGSNATAITIDSSENVGIGQTSPSSPNSATDFLHIGSSSSTYSSLILEDNNNTWEIFQNNQLSIRDGTATRLLIDTSGNVGIGTTSPSRVLHTEGASVLFGTTSGAHEILFGDSAHRYFKLYTPSSPDYASIRTGTTDILVAHSDGKVGIGTTSPAAQLHIATSSGDCTVLIEAEENSSSREPHLQLKGTNTSSNPIIEFGDSAGFPGTIEYENSDNSFRFGTNAGERMRINSSGQFLLNTTSNNSDSYKMIVDGGGGSKGIDCRNISYNADNGAFRSVPSGNTTYLFAAMLNSSNSTVGSIVVTSANTTYNTSSDYRLKENVTPLENGLDRLNQLKPVKFNWIESGQEEEGFIAHEVEEVFSYAVTGEKDAVKNDGTVSPQHMDYGRITPLLVKAIQEQQTIIEELKTRIETLEG